MGNILYSAAAFVVALGILITVHEFGHYWVARKAGVKVLRFSIGFGKPLWKWTRGPDHTEYVLAAVPLGGYVKMLDEREGEVAAEELPRAFNRQPLHKRFAIVFAGPLFNFLFAIVAYWLMFIAGIPGIKPIIDQVEPHSIAQQAGLRQGDEIYSIDGRRTPTWSSARLELLSKALDEGTAELTVQDVDGEQRAVFLDLASTAGEFQEGRVLERVGIVPKRPMLPAILGDLQQDGRAVAAGLKSGDKILAADGNKIKDWSDWVDYVRARPDQLMRVEIERNGQVMQVDLTPARIKVGGEEIGRIGAAPKIIDSLPEELKAELSYNPAQAFIAGCLKTWDMSTLTLRMLGKMIIGEVSVDNLSGPITIAKYAGYTASVGLTAFLAFLAIVSISLGVLNLLPIPMLDGGHLMLYIIELIKGRPISDAIQLKLQHIGLVILLLLMSVAFYNDITRLFD